MRPSWCNRGVAAALVAVSTVAAVVVPVAPALAATSGVLPAGAVVRVSVPEAVGGKTVIGQIAVDGVTSAGWAAAYPCDDGLPRTADGQVSRADLNYDGRVASAWSNRLIVEADDDGDVCVVSLRPAAIIVDVNAVTFDTGISSFANRRTDTRASATPIVAAGAELRVRVPEAVGGKTVVGNIAVDGVTSAGFVTAYGCDGGIPRGADGVGRADLNFDGRATSVWSNRLVVEADADGEICLVASKAAAIVVDVNGVSEVGLFSFDNRRIDTRTCHKQVQAGAGRADGVPTWPVYVTRPGVPGVEALSGRPADATVSARPIIAVKIDNFRLARPPWGLEFADAVIEENVEGVSRFVGLFHSVLPTDVGPVRSARTQDIDLLAAMNRPVFAYSGANPGVSAWIASASSSGLLVDHSAQRYPCYRRAVEKPGPHNLVLDAACAVQRAAGAGAAVALWTNDGAWSSTGLAGVQADATFAVPMDGVSVEWTWDAASGTYLRSQDGQPHVTMSGARLTASNVVVLAVPYQPSPVDARSPAAVSVGTGTGVVHRDGVAIPVIWSRATSLDPFQFSHAATGKPVPLDVGTTFLELTRQA